MPNALTKQKAASPPVRARRPAAATPPMPAVKPRVVNASSDWKVSHSLTKPLSGGSAEIAAAPTRKVAAVQGMRWINPPSASRSRVWVACCTAPAPRNSSALNTAWLST